jgi:acyl carrier protein
MDSTRNIVKSFIEESFLPGSQLTTIDDTTSFLETGLIDSTGVLELVDFLEEQFEISVEDDELVPEHLDSVGKISKYLESKGAPAEM